MYEKYIFFFLLYLLFFGIFFTTDKMESVKTQIEDLLFDLEDPRKYFSRKEYEQEDEIKVYEYIKSVVDDFKNRLYEILSNNSLNSKTVSDKIKILIEDLLEPYNFFSKEEEYLKYSDVENYEYASNLLDDFKIRLEDILSDVNYRIKKENKKREEDIKKEEEKKDREKRNIEKKKETEKTKTETKTEENSSQKSIKEQERECMNVEIVDQIGDLKLLDHQLNHAKTMSCMLDSNYWCLDRSKLGTGKTFVGTWLALKYEFPNALVVCPAALINTWEDMEEAFGLPVVTIARGMKGILSYEKLRGMKDGILPHGLLEKEKIEEEVEMKNGKTKIQKSVIFYPTKMLDKIINQGCILIFDEIQKAKNKTSAIHIAVRSVIDRAKQLIEKGANSRILLLSGSPFDTVDSCINFLQLVRIIEDSRLAFTAFGNFELDREGYQGAQQMFDYCRMVDEIATERTIEDHPYRNLSTLKETIYQLYLSVIMPNLTDGMPSANIEIPLDVKNGFYNLSKQRIPILSDAINDLKKSVRDIEERRSNLNSIGAIIVSMYKIEYQKIEIFIRKAVDTLENIPNSKVVLVFNFTAGVDICVDHLRDYNPMILTGKTSKKERARIIKDFNKSNLRRRLIIANLTVVALGINLHDTDGRFPRYAFVDGNYNAINTHQVVYRFYRAGVKSIPHVRFVYVKDHSEVQILQSYAKKGKIFKEILPEQVMNGIKFPGDYEDEVEENIDLTKISRYIDYPLQPDRYSIEDHFDDEPDEDVVLENIELEFGIEDNDENETPYVTPKKKGRQ